jgi:hypothetical protein
MAATVSPRWERSLRHGFQPVTRVDVRLPGEGVVFEDLPVSSGSITLTRSSAVRGSGSLTIPDPTLFPVLRDGSVLVPDGAEIVIRSGMRYPEGNVELVDMGVFLIESASGSEAAGNVTTIQFYDRARLVEQNPELLPQDLGGESALVAIEDIILDAAPFHPGSSVEWGFSANGLTDLVLPHGTVLDGGRWQMVMHLAEALGADVFFNRAGDAVAVPIPGAAPDLTEQDAAWIIDAGANGILTDARRGISRTDTYNAVLARGSADGDRPQPFAFVTDDNPLSRTFYGGPFGKKALEIANEAWTTDEQCEGAGLAKLRDVTGLQRTMDFSAIGNAAMDPGDILLVIGLDRIKEIWMLDGYTYNFETAHLSGDARAVQYIVGGS